MSQLIIEAVMAQAKADEAKAIANLNNYLSNSVGVGEHPDVVTEVTKLIKDVAEARELQEIIIALSDNPENKTEVAKS